MDSPSALQVEMAGGELAFDSSPDADGRPEGDDFLWSPRDHQTVPDTKPHRTHCNDVAEVLERHLDVQGREGYVGCDHNVYWDIDDLRRVVAPDVFVAFGVSGEPRGNYRIWAEGALPSFVMEVLSPTTRQRDLGVKKKIYEEMGVQEYFVFEGERRVDAQGRRRGPRLVPALQGYRLHVPDLGRPCYRRIPARQGDLLGGARISVGYASEVLDLDVVCAASKDGDRVRFHDPASGRFVLNHAEWREEETRRADEEARRAEAALAETAELKRRAEAAAAEIAELKRQLARRP